MLDRIMLPLIVCTYLIGVPISTGYFINRPCCADKFGSFMAGIIWPYALPVEVSSRVFSATK